MIRWHPFKSHPALTRCLVLGLGLTLVSWIGLRLAFQDSRPSVFFLGDSFLANYRMRQGERFQDMIQASLPNQSIRNWAHPGASPLDFFFQFERGKWVTGKPKSVFVVWAPDLFLTCPTQPRFDEDGANLRWLPWNASGWRLLKNLPWRERKVATLQSVGLPFYAVTDMLRSLWIQYVKWPSKRRHAQNAGPKRKLLANAEAARFAISRDNATPLTKEEFAAMPRARDGEFLIQELRQQGLEPHVLLVPMGNPHLLQKICSPQGLAFNDTLLVRMREWLQTEHLAFIDFNTPEAETFMPDSVWDDFAHVKSPSVYAYIGRELVEAFPSLLPSDGTKSDVHASNGSALELNRLESKYP